jgi:predicted RNA binding protein YcfA (HicA-like mRNA interferase family)
VEAEMKTSEATRKLSKNGCKVVKHGKKHDHWESPITGKRFSVPRHQAQELSPKTKEIIEELSGVKL